MPQGRNGRETARSPRDSSARKPAIPIVGARLRGISRLIALASCLSAASGCANQQGFLTGGPSKGQLKASLTHAEVENQKLQKQVAQLRTDNRSMEDRLVREEQNNGDLTARLDNARNLLRGRGIDGEEGRRASAEARPSTFDEDGVDDPDSSESGSRRTLPAGQRDRKSRKPPFARIPGRIEPANDDDEDGSTHSSSRPTWSTGGRASGKSSSRNSTGNKSIDDQAKEDQLSWTSVDDLNAKAQAQTTRR